MQLEALQPLIGEWTVTAEMPGLDPVSGRTTFEWLAGGGYVIQRTYNPGPFPQAIMVCGPDAGGEKIVQHYFDSRGVARIYDVSFEGGVLKLWRDGPDFAQRYEGRLSADGKTVAGRWERHDGTAWIHDFDLTYEKVE
jgi:hypothetical protein